MVRIPKIPNQSGVICTFMLSVLQTLSLFVIQGQTVSIWWRGHLEQSECCFTSGPRLAMQAEQTAVRPRTLTLSLSPKVPGAV